jgi:superfamily II DNA or RNA helicase
MTSDIIHLDKNITNFPSELNKLLNNLYKNNDEIIKKTLFDYQRYIFNYLVFTDARGILLYHSVGSGKTLTSISIAEEFRKLGQDIIILSSKSLQNNYKKEIKTYLDLSNDDKKINDDDADKIINQYKFVTSNAKNMIQSLDDKLTSFMTKYKSKEDDSTINLENKVIIIDEAHNLFNSIVNGSKIANEFYDIIMNTKKIKLIFLTGTPIINNPFEIAVAFNMLYGKIISNDKSLNNKKNYHTILPEYYADFQKYFVDISSNSLKNEDKFKNRIYGLVSYYGDMYNNIVKSIKDDIKILKAKENYPDRLPIKIETIEMSLIQNIEYMKARDIEKKETSKFYGQNDIIGSSIVKEKNAVSTSYRIKSRQLSNIYIPDVQELTLYNFNKYSPKIVSMYNNIKTNHKKQISLVYSTFLDSGLLSFVKYLELNNYTSYSDNSDSEKLHYAIFSGQQTSEEKENIIKICNSEENKSGDLISILLISKSGAEGLDLKNVRSVHIMEPYWNYSLIEQIIARAVRYKSHELLPKEEQNVQTYIYLSDYNSEFLKKEKDKIKENMQSTKKMSKIEFTTDINIFKNAIKNQELIQLFLKIIASTSIECDFLNKKLSNGKGINYDCFNCLANNKQLYYPDIHKDIELSNACLKTNKVTAEEIIINGEKFYYTIDPDSNTIKIFKFNNILNAYQLINDTNISQKIKNYLDSKK